MTARDELVAILDAVDFNHDSGSGDFASNGEYADAILANWTPQTVTAEQVEAAIHALLSTACDEDGWLSDMQYGNHITPDFEERLIDVGIGTIDVQHAVGAVLEAVKWTPQTATEPDEDLVEAVGIILREHQPTTGMSVASGVTCRCGYWNGQEVAGVTRPPGYNALMWHHVQLIAAVIPSRAEVLDTWAKNLSLYDEMGNPDPAWVAGIESARSAALDEAARLRENEVKS